MTRATTFLGLMLLCPCPWYMLAVGGLLPLPVIVAYGRTQADARKSDGTSDSGTYPRNVMFLMSRQRICRRAR